MTNEKILDKIRKLLSLATSDNKEEASSAYKKAMELMLKNNIETIDKKSKYEYGTRYSGVETQEMKHVSQILLHCFFVQAVKGRRFNSDLGKMVTYHKFAGEEKNLEIALYAYDFLLIEFRLSWLRYKKENSCLASEKQSYYYGMMYGFEATYDERKNYVQNKYAVSIPDKDPDLADFIKNEIGSKGNSRPKFSPSSRDAARDGMKRGSEISIYKGVESSNSNSEPRRLIS